MQQVWRKRWRHTGWIALGAVTLVLFISSVNRKIHKVCNGIEVSFSEEGNNFFVDEKGIVSLLKSAGVTQGQEIKAIDLKALEARLKNDKWIANAELFFDNKQVLQVIIEEKQPVARIFTVGGTSFYIDSACRKLPLSEKLSARIPMFTGFPSDRTVLSKPDSILLASVKELAVYIQADEFWKAQVAQVDITPEGFEMIPTIGSHVVGLGKEGNWQQKFDRLFSFYKQVWTKVGFEKYERIDVQFNNQVVATIKGAKPTIIDSARVRVAYENLLAEAKKSTTETISAVLPAAIKDTVKAAVVSKTKSNGTSLRNNKALPLKVNAQKVEPKREIANRQPVVLKAPARKQTKPQPIKQVTSNKRVETKKVPKAVMKGLTP